ncbi:MAG: hypothetical protein JSR99_09935 [Proteobacteria bacterium]|nr:hypothetical protein [Pseudomonadota bacterium]
MAEIIDFQTRASRRAADEPDADTIEVLEHFLELARAGVVQSIAIVTTDGFANPECAISMELKHAPILLSRLRVAIERIEAAVTA